MLVASRYLKDRANVTQACVSTNDFVDALAYYLQTKPAPTSAAANSTYTFNPADATQVDAAIEGAAKVCGVTNDVAAFRAAAAKLASSLASLASKSLEDAEAVPLSTLFYLVKLAGAVQRDVLPQVTKDLTDAQVSALLTGLEAQVDAFPAAYGAVVADLGLGPYVAPADTEITGYAAGVCEDPGRASGPLPLNLRSFACCLRKVSCLAALGATISHKNLNQ